ncbi:MAG: ABC transporter substrate-binding protein [Deferribacteraceae bacterium]|nr:ABC transporter substrate-binding protein [Deferribacteraceae bacterium]
MKRLIVALLLIVAAVCLFGCEKKKTKVIMATEVGFAPYEYYKGSDVVGIDPDIAAEIAKEMGVELEIMNMNFDTIPDAIKTGRADFAAAGMSITDERKQVVDFSIEYATSEQVIIVLADSPIKTPADLAGKVVAVQEGTVADLYLNDFVADAKTLPSKKYFEAVSNLTTGRADAILLDKLPAQEIVKTAANLIILPEPLFTDKYALAVQKGNKELLDTINKVLTRLIAEGKIDELTLKHLQ